MTQARRPVRIEPTAADLLNELDQPDWHTAGSTTRRPDTPTGSSPHSGVPFNAAVLTHITETDGAVDQFIARARAAGVPGPSPAPGNRAAAFAEAHRAANLLGPTWERYLQAREWQAATDSALLMGDATVIRREPCPECRTWGLVWARNIQRASCINRNCAARNDGVHRQWTTAQLAYHAVARQPQQAAR